MNEYPSLKNSSPRWMSYIFWGAGLYNITWGILVSIMPNVLLGWAQVPNITPLSIMMFQCIGMTIFVIGLAYILSANHPLRYWPLIIAGSVGRILGPIGFVVAAQQGILTWSSGITILTNDLIWLPFYLRMAWIVYRHQLYYINHNEA